MGRHNYWVPWLINGNNSMAIIINLIYEERVKKKSKPNTNKINGGSLRNNTGRAWPMTPKAGVTLKRRRYELGGTNDR